MAMPQTLTQAEQEQRGSAYERALPESRAANPQPAVAIPTDDPAAALEFCQRLAALMQATAAVAPAGISQSGEGAGLAALAIEQSPRPDLSVVIPVYNEESNLPHLYRRLTAVLEQTGLSYEIVFVDDGSRDEGLSLLHTLASDDQRIVVVELARWSSWRATLAIRWRSAPGWITHVALA
jgi:hypothetical protein